MITLLALAFGAAQSAATPVFLKHTFLKGLKSEYSVDANLQIDERSGNLDTFLPHEIEYQYKFFTRTLDVSDGIATLRYSRPSIIEIKGPTVDSDPIPKTEKLDQLATLQLSPINQVLDYKDQTPGRKKTSDDPASLVTENAVSDRVQESVMDFIAPFIIDLEQLSVFIGGIDGSLDLEPKFSLDAVKVGDTWKRTVGYQPQRLSSKAGKTVVQRLDLVYTYNGLKESRGRTVQRVHGELKLDTDLGKYVNDLFNAKPENTGLRSIPTRLKIEMDFDLDPTTMQTVYASVASAGSFKIFAFRNQDAVIEQNIQGTSEMRLVSNKNLLSGTAKR
ncbi:MAG: hypothetical protein ACYC96_00970 [Fimbriimonadaceae bacterium]